MVILGVVSGVWEVREWFGLRTLGLWEEGGWGCG